MTFFIFYFIMSKCTLYKMSRKSLDLEQVNVRRFDSFDPRLCEAEVFFAYVHAAGIDLAAVSEKAIQISFLKLLHSKKQCLVFL
jgi:hypothetical protein